MRAVSVACAFALIGIVWGVAEAQGPIINNNGSNTIAKPKKPADPNAPPDETDLPKIPSAYSKKDKPDLSNPNLPTFKTNIDIVTLDAAVLDSKTNQFIPGIPPNAFRVLEDNVPQKVTKVDMGEAPLTVALLIEFSQRFQRLYSSLWYQTLQLSWGFASTLKPTDYLAVIAYDMKPEILSDFSTNRQQAQEALQRLNIPAWSESNMFDAVTDTADRMSGVEGRKAIVMICSGIDTFSRLTFDQTRKKLQEAGVPVYPISVGTINREMADARGQMGSIQRMDFLQADNELRTFAKETGGQAFFPRFEGEYPGIFGQIQQTLRSQYVITYSSSNKAHDGAFRKIKIELVDPATNNPVNLKDEKGKPIKYSVIAKPGYKAPRAVE
jgi:VWFA-related protein